MKALQIAFLVASLGLSAAAIATSPVLAAGGGNRPTAQIAADLGVTQAEFVACFKDVRPDRAKAPSAARQQANKAVLLPCLQAANPEITNARLDAVMDAYRPEGPMRRN